MRRAILGLVGSVAALAFGVGGAATPAASANVRSCPTPHGLFSFAGGHQEYLADLSARNLSCRQALADLHRATIVGWPPNLRLRRFSCTILEGGGGGATVRCVRHHPSKAIRVSIGT